uniref:Uncharacterized protein n=1 Tax=Lotus japonicus TaxID=34305 RepID=I3SIQ5_LOTJA|nr:unknown [Lotus japonicus]
MSANSDARAILPALHKVPATMPREERIIFLRSNDGEQQQQLPVLLALLLAEKEASENLSCS